MPRPCFVFLRRKGRMIQAILRRGNIEPVMLILLLNLVLPGLTLMAASSTPVLIYPKAFGVFYLCLALVGFYGLFGRDNRAKALFGFIGLFLRLWMAARFLIADWQDPAWCSYLLGAAVYGWIGARSACRYVWVRTRRQVEEA